MSTAALLLPVAVATAAVALLAAATAAAPVGGPANQSCILASASWHWAPSDSWGSAPEKPLYGVQSDAASLRRALRHQSLHCVELHSAFNLFLSRTIQAGTICIALCPASILTFSDS